MKEALSDFASLGNLSEEVWKKWVLQEGGVGEDSLAAPGPTQPPYRLRGVTPSTPVTHSWNLGVWRHTHEEVLRPSIQVCLLEAL